MKKMIATGTILVLSISFLGSAFGQEFSFRLYLESLANGKKDTLELGIAPDGYVYYLSPDSLLEDVVYSPFADAVEHIGAYLLPKPAYHRIDDDYQRTESLFVKRLISRPGEDISVILPLQALPVRLSWDSLLLSSPEAESPLITDWHIGGRPDATAPGMSFMGYMDRISGMTVYSLWQLLEGEQEMGTRDFLADLGYPYFRIPGIHDSARMHVAITDSMGEDHLYKPFYIALGYDAASGMEETVSRPAPVLLFPNPASSSFSWQSEIPVRAWEIYDISGKRIMQGDARQTRIDCRNWHEGVYIFVCIDIQGCTSSQKIIKK